MITIKEKPNTPEGWITIPVGRNTICFVDLDDFERLNKFHWRRVRSGHCFYPMRRFHQNGKTYNIRMHREIMHTPPGYECHHKNHNTFDCRKENLENLTPPEHRAAHNKL